VDEKLHQIADLLKNSHNTWAFTGAGVSTESGIPDFRSHKSGIWQEVDPMEVASVDGFLHDTPRFYEFWHWRFAMLDQAEPNLTHRWLASLEMRSLLRGVITQNIDGLHRQAGSERVYEIHGCFREGLCIQCQQGYTIEQILERAQVDGKPRCDSCQGLLKPDVTLFGEMLPEAFYEAMDVVGLCEVLLVLGTSLEVFPAADIVPRVKQQGGSVIVINADETGMDFLADVIIHDRLAKVIEPLSAIL
jgi:NAD-dependent deacetylase